MKEDNGVELVDVSPANRTLPMSCVQDCPR